MKVDQYRTDPYVSMNKTGRASLRYIDSDSDQVFQITRWGYVRFYPRKLEADKLEERLLTALGMLNGAPLTVLDKKVMPLAKDSEHELLDTYRYKPKVFYVGKEAVPHGTLLTLTNNSVQAFDYDRMKLHQGDAQTFLRHGYIMLGDVKSPENLMGLTLYEKI